MGKHKVCHQCRLGGIYNEPAVAFAWGKFYDDHDINGKFKKGRIWKSHLCDTHCQIIGDDCEVNGKPLVWYKDRMLKKTDFGILREETNSQTFKEILDEVFDM